MIWLLVNESLVLSLTSSLKVKFDSLEIEPIMGLSNNVRDSTLTQGHDDGHASMDSVVESTNKPVFAYLQKTLI